MTAVESSGPCSLGEECAEYKNLAFLLVSLGITIILVGALFYYVKQRFEVLEVSHKEQIGVMRNFIASISDQFQRMSAMGALAPIPGQPSPVQDQIQDHQAQTQKQKMQPRDEDRLSISESDSESESEYDEDGDDDDDYDNDSDSSNTDIMDAYRIRDGGGSGGNGGSGGGDNNDIIICNDLSNIKIIEIFDADNIGGAVDGRFAGEPGNTNTGDDSDDLDDDDDSEDSTESEDREDREDIDDCGDAAESNQTKRMIIIKSDSVALKDIEPKEDLGFSNDTRPHDRNMVIDLDIDNTLMSPLPVINVSNASSSNSYAQMSIKQLRQAVKRLSEHSNLDTSKLKRDQLLALLEKI